MSDNQDKSTLTEVDFMRLLLQHENALRAFARSLLPDWDAVDDVIQDASVIMWQKTGFMDFPLLKNYLESKRWTVWAARAFIETDKAYRCRIKTTGIEVSIDSEEGSIIFDDEDAVIAHLRSIFK